MIRSRYKRKGKFTAKQSLFLKISLAVIVVLLVGIVAINNEHVQGRLLSVFGNNEKLQKQEYERQKELAAKKYGSSSSHKQATAATTASQAEQTSATSSSAVTSTTNTSTLSSSAKKTIASGNYTTYTVQSGDYLSTIAAEYDTSVQELMELNDLSSSSVRVGEVLKVPLPTSQSSSANTTSATSAGSDDEY